MKRVVSLLLVLMMVFAVVLSAQAKANYITKITFTTAPTTFSGTTMNTPVVASDAPYKIVAYKIYDVSGSKAEGAVLLRAKLGYMFEPTENNYYLDAYTILGSIGKWSAVTTGLPNNVVDEGCVLDAQGAQKLNTYFLGGSNTAMEGDLMLPFTLTKEVPTTGDNSSIALWLSLVGLSAAGFVILSKRKVNG